MKVYDPAAVNGNAPADFQSTESKGKDYPGWKFTLQVFPDDCTGCGLCVEVCPAKDKAVAKHKAIDMEPKIPHLERERKNLDFFLSIPEADRGQVKADTVKGSQLLLPLFEFSGACAGCGETPYVKLITQFFGDRMMIANATGCSSIYGGNLPCTPYTMTSAGKGPAWSNSLFEDAGEFGFGMRLAVDQQVEYAQSLLRRLASQLGDEMVAALLNNKQQSDVEIRAAAGPGGRVEAGAGADRRRGRGEPGRVGRLPDPQEHLVFRRRRLCLRYRLRRPGSHLRFRP